MQEDETVDAKWAAHEEIQQMIDNGEFVYSVGVRYGKYRHQIVETQAKE